MQETSHAFFHLDDHENGASLYAAPILLKGWTVAKPGYLITDLRVRLAGNIYPVFHGHPRRDLAQYFKAATPHLLAGFEVELPLFLGENLLEFEFCEISGQWLPLVTMHFNGTPCGITIQPPKGDVQAHAFARALRLTLQRMTSESPDRAAASVVAPLPLPYVTRYPALPFHGHLHHPPLLQRTEFGRVIVEGWLFHETEKIRQVTATVDLQAWQVLEHGSDHPYVAGLFGQFPNAAACRIHGAIDVPSQLPQPVSVRVYAELFDGSWHLCHVQRNYFYDDEQIKAPYPRRSLWTMGRAVHALRKASLARGFSVPLDNWFRRALREVWIEYGGRAPRGKQRAVPPSPASHPVAGDKLPGTVALVTHNLNFEGAPLFLLEYAAYLNARGVQLRVISGREGPLRSRFEALGAGVDLVEITPLLKAKSVRELRAELVILSRQIDLGGVDLLVANTLSAYWGIHLAKRAGVPSLFYIHESTTPDCFYFGYMAPETLPVVKESFVIASHVSFLTETTRRYYRPILGPNNHSINPGWLDLTRVDKFRAQNSRAQLRAHLGIPPSTLLVVNIGSVCNRKGQHIFARAVDLVWRRMPELAGKCEFLMVGGRDTAYDGAIAELVGFLKRPNLRVVPETSEPYVYYGAADLFVCSSYEESFPRVVLEAMAFELPIVSSDVHGIPEMARNGKEAVLVQPGNSSALAEAMVTVLCDAKLASSLGGSARDRVSSNFDATTLLPRHGDLAGAIYAGKK